MIMRRFSAIRKEVHPMDMQDYLVISDEVQEALANNEPVVALESTIISHGMPYPRNVETALKVEGVVRENGAVPATICILQGKISVGISEAQIEHLGKSRQAILKASRRDLPVLLSKGLDGATTVASTMIGAAMAGIRVFATGGIGGVHRGGETTMDISADLEELAITRVLVVCAGCKSILDIGLTLEYLETKGIPVIGYQTSEFPAFYTIRSGHRTDCRLNTPAEIAAAFLAKEACDLKGGMVIANPVPAEYAMDEAYISRIIGEAVQEASRAGIKGKEVTPFLLDRIQSLTGGQSLETNIQLVFSNAALAAKIAGALSIS
jgi:pseudouridylate synthase